MGASQSIAEAHECYISGILRSVLSSTCFRSFRSPERYYSVSTKREDDKAPNTFVCSFVG